MAGPRSMGMLGVSLVVLLTACGKEAPKEPLSPRVYVQQVNTREFAPPIQLSGDIQARVETQLSFRVGLPGVGVDILYDFAQSLYARANFFCHSKSPPYLIGSINSSRAPGG